MLWYLRILWSSSRFWFKIYCHIAVAVWIIQQIWCYTVTLCAGLTPGVKMNPCTLVLGSAARVNLASVPRVHEVTLGSRIDSVCHCRVEKKPPELHVGSSVSHRSASGIRGANALHLPRHLRRLRIWIFKPRRSYHPEMCRNYANKRAGRKSVLCGSGFFFNDTKGLLSQLTMMDEGSFPFLTRVFKRLLSCTHP